MGCLFGGGENIEFKKNLMSLVSGIFVVHIYKNDKVYRCQQVAEKYRGLCYSAPFVCELLGKHE